MIPAAPQPRPAGSTAVMACRREPPDSLDLFCTPPWATRALVHHVLGFAGAQPETVWEPAAGYGHMVEVLRHLVARIGRLASGAGRCRTAAPSLTLGPLPCRSKPRRLVAITFQSSSTK